jgi:hypothetical protein
MAMKLLGAHTYIYHRLFTIIDVGEYVVIKRSEEIILNSEAIGEVKGKQLNTPCVLATWPMRAEYLA